MQGRASSMLQCLTGLSSRPWLGWAFVYAFVLFLFSVYRCTTLKPLVLMYASAKDYTTGMVLKALGLGVLEDLVCATYFACALWAFDSLKWFVAKCTGRDSDQDSRLASKFATFTASWLLFVAMVAPFVADLVLVRLRSMRFTFDLVAMAINERDHAKAVAVSSSEISEAMLSVTEFLIVATFFAIVRTWAAWADLSAWNPTHLLLSSEDSLLYVALSVNETKNGSKPLSPRSRSPKRKGDCQQSFKQGLVALAGLVLFPVVVVAISCASKPLVAYSALNTTLNELFAHGLEPTLDVQVTAPTIVETVMESVEGAAVSSSGDSSEQEGLNTAETHESSLKNSNTNSRASGQESTSNNGDGASQQSGRNETTPIKAQRYISSPVSTPAAPTPAPTPAVKKVTLPWVETFIDYKTEEHTLLGEDTLHRRTTGFKGDLAFDVKVNPKNPPNVLVIVVEAFRYHDSHYLVGEKDPSNLFKGSNITITPNFDKWAKRNIALRNFWSSWRTSRSVESLMFAQLPYDSVTKSGMTGGQQRTKLAGLPQLYSAKGYETFFTTGCLTDYDGWDSFLPTHGFDTVWSRNEMMRIAENEMGIRPDQWRGEDHRGLDWGVHDDLSFQILGDLMVKKAKEQAERVARGEPKKPLFLNHYTISSHVDFKQRPKWYDEAEKPDFSALYNGEEFADNIKNYLEMRYFADMEMGKFLDRMAKEGILNDTIIVISGDHGQGPEFGNDVPEDRDVSATRVAGAIIAEGRLGNASGMVIDDATEQYDILNTLADITGVPEGGFEQDGVGRSLKRKMQFGERTVYSNNPTRKMSVVRGHLRLRYERMTDYVLLHNADTDHDMKNDLLPGLSDAERLEWVSWRDKGRLINSYYTKHWEKRCLLDADC
ncbi:sulfatase-like protein [Phytophthora cinnamomi]|uniref:sulfatase-like protein n=1 Tax=Phytophthora cinnamomi TaxID=4785 RepID=UPI0035593928|nr:sulfatase-like protein [Phytophthora cinnamomi]